MTWNFKLLHRLLICLSGLIVLHCGDETVETDDMSTDSGHNDAGAVDSDSEGDRSTDSASDAWAPTVEDAYTEVDRPEIGVVPFVQDTILEYHITMDPAVYADMEEHGDDEAYRKASLEVRGGDVREDYSLVGIRYKGDYSLHHCWDEHGGVRSHSGECAKLNIKVKFDEYNEDARFFGLKRINLHAMGEDDTKLRERLAYSIFNDFGVTTARTAHAKLYINDAEPLLVLAVEQVDGRFTAYHYPAGGDGNLYKETWPNESLTESELLPQLRTNENPEDNPDVSRFIAFGDTVASSTETSFDADMADFVVKDQILRYMAVDRATKNWDGITAFYWQDRPHNLYWYHDVETSNLFHLVPWDLDKTFWEFDPYLEPSSSQSERPVPDWNVLPLSCDSIWVWYGSVYTYPSGCDHFMNLLAATGWDDFVTLGQSLLDTAFQTDAMNEKVTAWAEQIAAAVDEDPVINKSAWESAVADFPRILQKARDDFASHLAEGYIVEE